MADNNEVKIKISAQDEATPTIKAAIDRLNQSMASLNQTMLSNAAATKQATEQKEELNVKTINLASAFSLVMGAAQAAQHVYESITHTLREMIEESSQSEQVSNRLTAALTTAGLQGDSAADKINEYAEAVQRVTGHTADSVKTMITQSLQMGMSISKAREMEEAARKLADATGKDVNEAFSLLQGTLSGNSRGLARMFPQIKDMTEAQLKMGGAIKFVSEKADEGSKLFQGSYEASVKRFEASHNKLNESIGNFITKNPLVKKGIETATEAMIKLAETVEKASKWFNDHSKEVETVIKVLGRAAIALGALKLAQIAYNTYLAAGTVGANLFKGAMTGVATALKAVNWPMLALQVGIVAVSAAMEKWPSLYERAIGVVKILAGVISSMLTGALAAFAMGVGKVASALGLEFGKSLEEAGSAMLNFNYKLMESGAQQVITGEATKETTEKINDEAVALAKAKKELEEKDKAQKELTKSYMGINIGSEKYRQSLEAEVSTREKDKKDFEQYLEAKKRLSISKKEEERRELNALQAKSLAGTGGSAETEANARVAIDAEAKKQEGLKVERDKGLLNQEQYNAAMLASQQRQQQAALDMAQEHAKAKADLLGESEEGYALRQQIAEDRFQLELQQKLERAEMEMATDEEIFAMKQEMESVHKQQMLDAEDAHNNALAQREEISGATITATRKKWFSEQEKAQSQRIKSFASGVDMMINIQTAMNQTFSQLGDALVKNQKISASKFVGIFLEMLGRQVMQKGFADLVMGLFPPNPVQLGVGAAEVAGGTAIARLGVSMQGGQADEGLDAVPGNLAGKSFILSQGERVVQPEANKDLKDFLKREKEGSSGAGGGGINITLNYNGSGSQEDATKMADIVISEIRRRSDRGVAIMSPKGLSNA